MKKLFFLLVLLIPLLTYSQVSDNFENGNISTWTQSIPGHWNASDSLPIDGTYSLHQNFLTSVTGYYSDVICLYIGSINVTKGLTTWQFQVKYKNTNPSSSNNWNIYLMSDADDKDIDAGNADGYVLGVDFGSKTDDILTLNKVTNGQGTTVISTSYKWDVSGVIGIKVTRTDAGNWEIFVDDNGGFDNLISVGTGNDNTFTDFSYFGIVYKYTKTNCRKFWLDDLTIDGPPDQTPPKLSKIQVLSPSKLELLFSERLDTNSAQSLTNYLVDNNISNPVSALLIGAESRTVDLTFASSFQENKKYSLSLSNIKDLSANKIKDTSVAFSWQNIKVVSVLSVSDTLIDVKFSKIPDQTTAENANNYSLDNSLDTAISASLDANDKTLIHLKFANSLQNNLSYNLTVQNVKDLYGNTISASPFAFVFHQLQQFDVVINELMIDVSPAPAVLPANKYIELYNTSDFDIDLNKWTMQIGTNSAKTFPATIIKSHAYAIICSSNAEAKLSQYGTTIPILTESQLTSTTGKKIVIKNNSGKVIDDLTYSPDWYVDPDKQSGGWSLERIDPTNFCNQQGNWHASENSFGGTPGMKNSVFASNKDTKAPFLISYKTEASVDVTLNFSETVNPTQAASVNSYILNTNIYPVNANIDANDNSIVHLQFANHFNFGENSLKITSLRDYCDNVMNDTIIDFKYQLIHPLGLITMSKNQLKVYFSEPINLATSENINNYLVDESIGNPDVATRDFNDYSIVYLMFNKNFEQDKELNISIKGISDANGNIMHDTSLKFVYHITKSKDLVINEVLYNPYPNCSDFVELYNRSGFPIDLQKIRIAKRNDAGDIASDYYLTKNYSVLLPDSFVVITADSANINKTYTCGDNFVQLSSMPSFPDDQGDVVVLDEKDTIIDEFRYNDDMQFALLSNTEGVSLERIDYNQPTQDSSNWHSAAESAGFATPGLKNSQYRNVSSDSTIGNVSLTNQVFSPDNDGYNDQLYINYKFDESGYLADILIFDKNGILIRHLEHEQLIGTSGHWIWNGLDENQKKVNIGMYAIVVKIFDLKGKVHLYRETAVVAGKR